ncbi:zinc finger Ran-binding domain-containing protein 2 [Selaginella moellendorffii]|uniref:zinc finger Ran-binding domain-containing protein 2 n=1 Tax=Selaginella moellendorffii TaxID=88036 RepID=UPI000D1C7BE5|nr:zinc finger Ran-binding domain-containing protein 2 [Selaginella moellendorffii]|eukprot:XP_002986556.2 zinc finger Ran-binding domain-containing protein 2 [Selaginella moellendorffii]
MLGAARNRLLAPAAGTIFTRLRAALTGGGKAWYSSDFDLGKKPGDWDCATCFHLNFSRRDSCQRCGNPRPVGGGGGGGGSMSMGADRGWGGADVKPGDWFCPSCNTHNFASRGTCFKCGNEKVENNASMDGRPGWRMGDWTCTGCSEHNFASRTECFKCNAPKTSASTA